MRKVIIAIIILVIFIGSQVRYEDKTTWYSTVNYSWKAERLIDNLLIIKEQFYDKLIEGDDLFE